MYEEKVVLCGANSYEKKYYLNPDFEALPQEIQDELKILCVLDMRISINELGKWSNKNMYEEKVVLCGANSYEKKYYLNPDFEALPQEIQDELKILCVLYTEDVGGILTLVFEEDGTLCFVVTTEDFDPLFDDIGSKL